MTGVYWHGHLQCFKEQPYAFTFALKRASVFVFLFVFLIVSLFVFISVFVFDWCASASCNALKSIRLNCILIYHCCHHQHSISKYISRCDHYSICIIVILCLPFSSKSNMHNLGLQVALLYHSPSSSSLSSSLSSPLS